VTSNTFVGARTDVLGNGTSSCWIGNTFTSGTVPSGGGG
jgi:hypothetical protein